jgi:hypothetical protein
MKLSEIFAQLTYGEFSQLSLGGAEEGAIATANYPKVAAHINLGLIALYKRFTLKEGRVSFNLEADRTYYKLSTEEEMSFLVDASGVEFADDILKIEQVRTADDFELPLNDSSNKYSCFTPDATTLRVPLDIVNLASDVPDEYITSSLTAVYRASHPLLVVTANTNPSKVNIELPYSHLEPLLYFVASRVHNPIGMTNEFHAGNSYAAKYEQACMLLDMKNLQVDQGSENTKLRDRGFV